MSEYRDDPGPSLTYRTADEYPVAEVRPGRIWRTIGAMGARVSALGAIMAGLGRRDGLS